MAFMHMSAKHMSYGCASRDMFKTALDATLCTCFIPYILRLQASMSLYNSVQAAPHKPGEPAYGNNMQGQSDKMQQTVTQEWTGLCKIYIQAKEGFCP